MEGSAHTQRELCLVEETVSCVNVPEVSKPGKVPLLVAATVEECTCTDNDTGFKNGFNEAQLPQEKHTNFQDAGALINVGESAAGCGSPELGYQYSMSDAIKDSVKIAEFMNFKEAIAQYETVPASDAEDMQAMLSCETDGLSGDDFVHVRVTQPANKIPAHQAYEKTVCSDDSQHRRMETTNPRPSTCHYSTMDKDCDKQVRPATPDECNTLGNSIGEQFCRSQQGDVRQQIKSHPSALSPTVDEQSREMSACSNYKSNLDPGECPCSMVQVLGVAAGQHGLKEFLTSENDYVCAGMSTYAPPHAQAWATSPQNKTCRVKPLLDSEVGDLTTTEMMPAGFEAAEGSNIRAAECLSLAECAPAEAFQSEVIETSCLAEMNSNVAGLPAFAECGALSIENDISHTVFPGECSSLDERTKSTDALVGENMVGGLAEDCVPDAPCGTNGSVCAATNSASSSSSPAAVEEHATTTNAESEEEDDNNKPEKDPVAQTVNRDPRVLLGERARWLVEQGEAQMAHWRSHPPPAEERARILNSLHTSARTLDTAEATTALLLLGKALAREGLLEEGARLFAEVVEAETASVEAWLHLGLCRHRLRRTAEAHTCYSRALHLATLAGDGSMMRQASTNLGVLYESGGLLLNAVSHYRDAAMADPDHPRPFKLLGSALFALGELELARAALHQSMQLDPYASDTLCDLGITLQAMGDDVGAEVAYLQAMQLGPELVCSLAAYNLGNLKLMEGSYEMAVAMYDRAIVGNPGNWRAVNNKGCALLKLGRIDQAESFFRKSQQMSGVREDFFTVMTHLKGSQKKSAVDPMEGIRMPNIDTSPSLAPDSAGGHATSTDVAEEKMEGRQPPARVGVEAGLRFLCFDSNTTPRDHMAAAMYVRKLHREAHMHHTSIIDLRKRFHAGAKANASIEERVITLEHTERRLRALLGYVSSETFQEAMSTISRRIVCAMDPSWWLGGVDWGTVVAALALLASGNLQSRQRLAWECLLWSASGNVIAIDTPPRVPLAQCELQLQRLAAVLCPPDQTPLQVTTGVAGFATMDQYYQLMEVVIPHLSTVAKLERTRHYAFTCSVCNSMTRGPKFLCSSMKSTGNPSFHLCCQCYSLGLIPVVAEGHPLYTFKEEFRNPLTTRVLNYVTGWN